MKQNSKKRVLLSSVAMLMVATVSLGSATYAWFTNNKSVTADKMQVQAASATGLQITGKNGAADSWGPTYAFTAGVKTLSPVSASYSTDAKTYSKFSEAFLPAEAKVEGPWTSEGTANFVDWGAAAFPKAAGTGEAFNANDNFAVYEVGVRSTAAAISDVKMQVKYTGSGSKNVDFIRVAVLKQASEETNITGDAIMTVIGNEENANAISAINPDVKTTAQKIEVGGEESEITIGEVKDAQYYTILVWFEGQDSQCIDVNQEATGEIDIKFYYE